MIRKMQGSSLCRALLSSAEFKETVKCLTCMTRSYTTSSGNGPSGESVSISLENIFSEESKRAFQERLKTVKPLVRPTKTAEYPRKAAVLVPFCRMNGEPSLLFMMRSLHLKNHAGEVCFPGGMQDEGDSSLMDTALRETQEEIGLDPASVDIWGQAAPLPSRHGHQVHPVIGYCGEVDLKQLTLNESEVYSVFTRPVSSFLVSENQRQTQFRHPGSRGFTLPTFTGGEHPVWGLTAIVIHQTLMIAVPELYNFKPKYQTLPVVAMDANWKPEYRENVVYLHVIPRYNAGAVVNLSPFALKYELWLRINNIPFETIDYMGMSSKGQSPFILWNGKEIPDSNFGIAMLCEHFKKDAFQGLTKPERGIARAFMKMLEENTAWPIFMYRYVEHSDEYGKYFMTKMEANVKAQIQSGLQNSVADRARKHGIGRHSSEEIQKIGCDDVQAISDFLGDKPYMMGDQPTLVDCSVFGVLSQVVYVPMGYPQRKHILDNCPNIAQLLDRLKTNYWPNWDEQCNM